MGLKEYARKRRFDITAEPPPRTPRRHRAATLHFVVQKHRATRLHYDFRLEWDGVLLSWAVPKGPSMDPAVKRLAMEVEDHPLDYADFEGVIPSGEYGGGTVMVWDRGPYRPATPDVGAAKKAGRVEFALAGKKLKGSWILVRTRGRDSRSWLLIKRHDEAATDADLLTAQPRSIKSKRLMAEIAFDEGGEVERAAGADPPDAIRALMRDPRTRRRKPHATPSVWKSTPRGAANTSQSARSARSGGATAQARRNGR
jgi:bifunctional non-homologous end joining protein LigD